MSVVDKNIQQDKGYEIYKNRIVYRMSNSVRKMSFGYERAAMPGKVPFDMNLDQVQKRLSLTKPCF